MYVCGYVNVFASVCLHVCDGCLRSLLTNLTQGSFNIVLMNRGFDLVRGSEPQAHTHSHSYMGWGVQPLSASLEIISLFPPIITQTQFIYSNTQQQLFCFSFQVYIDNGALFCDSAYMHRWWVTISILEVYNKSMGLSVLNRHHEG